MGINPQNFILSTTRAPSASTGETFVPNTRPLARTADPVSSRLAADANPADRRAQRTRLLAFYSAVSASPIGNGGATAREAERWANMPGSWRRVSELLAAGLLEVVTTDDGAPLLRALNGKGQRARVLRISDAGRLELADLAQADNAA